MSVYIESGKHLDKNVTIEPLATVYRAHSTFRALKMGRKAINGCHFLSKFVSSYVGVCLMLFLFLFAVADPPELYKILPYVPENEN